MAADDNPNPHKAYVLLRHNDGKNSVVADYGDYVWGAATYEVIGYFPTYRRAQQAAKELAWT